MQTFSFSPPFRAAFHRILVAVEQAQQTEVRGAMVPEELLRGCQVNLIRFKNETEDEKTCMLIKFFNDLLIFLPSICR